MHIILKGPVIEKFGNKWCLAKMTWKTGKIHFFSTRPSYRNWAQEYFALFSLTGCAEFKIENMKLLL